MPDQKLTWNLLNTEKNLNKRMNALSQLEIKTFSKQIIIKINIGLRSPTGDCPKPFNENSTKVTMKNTSSNN